jgi:hypothetical protein
MRVKRGRSNGAVPTRPVPRSEARRKIIMRTCLIVVWAVALTIIPYTRSHAGDTAQQFARRLAKELTAVEQQGGPDAPFFSSDAKGVAVTPDGDRFMVSKPLGADRWTVTWDAETLPGDVNGTVLTDRGVIFLHCPVTGVTGPDPTRDSLLVDCYSGDFIVPANGWSFLTSSRLPGTFFLP